MRRSGVLCIALLVTMSCSMVMDEQRRFDLDRIRPLPEEFQIESEAETSNLGGGPEMFVTYLAVSAPGEPTSVEALIQHLKDSGFNEEISLPEYVWTARSEDGSVVYVRDVDQHLADPPPADPLDDVLASLTDEAGNGRRVLVISLEPSYE